MRSAALLKPKEEPPYTLAMSLAEEQCFPTILVLYRIGDHKEVWNVCSNMCAARGLTREQSLLVVRHAEERAKRRMDKAK